ncbi:MAG TPA: protein-glutamate O-methyltransferase CheR [Terracidiphilus sp.]|nr:protein-glutamate O-methyltransferase CheR [Terracidiphilus sp.]
MPAVSETDYGFLRQVVYSISQNVLDPASDYLFDTRLSRVLQSQGMTELEELVQYLRLRRNPLLEHAIAEAMTINETSFFRDARPFELLRTELLPKLIELRKFSRGLRFWSAASSTGQEAYSIAMLICEHFPSLAAWNIRIEGTDIASEAVGRAQQGRFHRIEMNRGLPARYLIRYFDHVGDDWVAKPELRRLCHFRQANLCAATLPFRERFDVIFLRNVMLYLSQEVRATLLAGIYRLLAPDGILLLGVAEQPPDPAPWQPILAGGTCYFRPRCDL